LLLGVGDFHVVLRCHACIYVTQTLSRILRGNVVSRVDDRRVEQVENLVVGTSEPMWLWDLDQNLWCRGRHDPAIATAKASEAVQATEAGTDCADRPFTVRQDAGLDPAMGASDWAQREVTAHRVRHP
jgi:hypothetical protein